MSLRKRIIEDDVDGNYTTDEREQFLDLEGRRRKKARLRNILIGTFIFLAVVLSLGAFVLTFFTVDTVIVEGSERYDYTSIVEASGITNDDLVFSVSGQSVNDRLCEKFPFVKNAKLIREYPSTVIIEIEEEKPKFYYEFEGEFFVLGSKLKVLDRFTEYERMIGLYGPLISVKIPKARVSVVSFTLEFVSEKESKHVEEALDELYECKLIDKITQIDVSLRFDMNVMYDDRIRLELGGVKDFKDKLDFARGILKTYSEKATGVIYIDNVVEAYALVEDV